MQNDFIIVLAWPEGMVGGTGAWYDFFLSKKGKYRVGHSALALINSASQQVHYFDFGRYHTPHGFGRVRDAETDEDLKVIQAVIENGKVKNIKQILFYLSKMDSTHAEGKMYGSLISNINFQKSYNFAKKMQDKGMLQYGPFIRNGTNCSRFVASVIKSSGVSFIKRLRLKYPFCISPSPKRNVCISNHNYYVIENNKCLEVKKNKFHAYFSSIEIK